jgi:GntR family transcriptional regulator
MPETPSPPRRTTLHKSLSDELLRMIKNGDYPVGSNLPTENELCARFGVSRHTVREATRRLSDLGLVVRKPRTGTTVVRQHTQPQIGLALENTEQRTDRPISWTDIYIRREYQAVVEHIGQQPGGVYPLFERLCDETVETIDMEISAATFPAAIAKRLGYTKSDPALLMVRRFRNPAGKLLEVAVSYYPPFGFRYMSRLTRVQGRHQTAP